MSDLDLLRHLGDQIIPPPLDELRTTAQRRTRRTTTVATLAVAAVAAIAVGAVQLGVAHHDVAPTNPPEQSGSRPLTYADGTTVHYGDQTVTMPSRVVELDLTDDGVAVRTTDNRVWFTDGSAVDEISAIGESGWTDDQSGDGDYLWAKYVGRIVSSESGSEVAWFEFPEPFFPEVVVYDTAAGQVVFRQAVEGVNGPAPNRDTAAGLYSVDSNAVYGFTDLTYGEEMRPIWRIDLDTGAAKPLFQPRQYQAILQSNGLARTLLISDENGEPSDLVPYDGVMEFSVNGTRVTPAGKDPQFVKDGLTGQDVEFSAPPGYPETDSLWLVQWLDDDTVVLKAAQRDGIDLLQCRVSTGACELAEQLPADAVVPEVADPTTAPSDPIG